MVNAGVGDDDETGFLERAGDVVSEGTGGETAGNSLCASVCGVFEDGTVSVRTGRDNTDVVRVVNGGNDTGGKNKLFPGLSDVEDVDSWGYDSVLRNAGQGRSIVLTISSSLPDVRLHLLVAVFCANMTLGSQEKLDLLLGRTQDGR